jgi:Lipocalin-like domain
MKYAFVIFSVILITCGATDHNQDAAPRSHPIMGTWRLLKGTLIEHGDTTITDYTKNGSFIKIINDTHFAFLQHDASKGKDSTVFVAGGGPYDLKDSTYTEHLQYCSSPEWEGHDFAFTVRFNKDTLTQYGIEKVEKAGVNRINIETYVRVMK